ncbi:MAG TPA: HAD family hydrolase [Acidobacteriaceae bacterium]|nr:HAD family hydrolase [Acidobacteriaceae bacterium]
MSIATSHSGLTKSLPAGIVRLTTPQFHEQVLALNPKVAVFDCDGTLWSGDAGSHFMNWSMEQGLLSRDLTEWLDERHRSYRRGEVSELIICGEMVRVYRSLRLDEMRAAAATFFREHVEQNIFPEMLSLVTELQKRGTEIWAVSSTNEWVIEEGVKRFHIPADHVLAAAVHVRDGLVTGDLRDVPTDEGKVASLKRVGITAPDCVFGNSIHDAACSPSPAKPSPSTPPTPWWKSP